MKRIDLWKGKNIYFISELIYIYNDFIYQIISYNIVKLASTPHASKGFVFTGAFKKGGGGLA